MARLKKAASLLLLGLSCSVSTAKADDFLSRYNGTTIRLDWTYPQGKKSSGTVKITNRGITSPGSPTFGDRRISKTSDGHGGTEMTLVIINDNGYTMEFRQKNSKLRIDNWFKSTISFVGDQCNARAASNLYSTIVVQCTVMSKSDWRAKDDPRACKVVRDAINEIRSLTTSTKDRDTFKAAKSCDKMNSITRSIKGAGCPSQFANVDAALKKAKKSCQKIDHQLSDIGVRG